MATHSSVLAWRIPATGEPGGLPDIYGVTQSRTRLKWLSSSSSSCCCLPCYDEVNLYFLEWKISYSLQVSLVIWIWAYCNATITLPILKNPQLLNAMCHRKCMPGKCLLKKMFTKIISLVSKTECYFCFYLQKEIWLILEHHKFELHGTIYTWISFFF